MNTGSFMMRTATRLVSVGLALLTMPRQVRADAPERVNLVPNAGFETADGRQPAFWAQRTPSDEQRTLSWDAQVRRTGQRSVKIENRAAVLSRWRTGHLRDIGLEPGSKGQLSAWLETRNADGGAYLKLYFMDAEAGIVEQPTSAAIKGTKPWTEVRLPFTVPAKTAYVMVYLELSGTGTAWFDDVVLRGTRARSSSGPGLPERVYGAQEFERLEGYAHGSRLGKTVLELSPKAIRGRAETIFWGESARYDVVVHYFDESDGAASLQVILNDKQVAAWRFADTPTTTKPTDVLRHKVIRGVDIQRWSRIALEGQADQGECCRVHKVTFRLAGRFDGQLLPEETLRLPPTLRLYVEPEQRRRAKSMLGQFVGRGVARATERRKQELAALETPQQWRERQVRTRARLREFFGDFQPKCPLNARIVGTLDRPDYRIEKLIFESQPRYHCTANVYIPKRRRFPQPGVFFTCGHAADGKAYHLYHEACLGFVLKGYVVLALDPMGQGERSEYFDPKTGKSVVPLCVSQHHYLARPSWLVGRTLAGYRTWDCIRALDYLVTRSEVDPERIAAVGNSGGGIMALLITAVDERIKVCAAAHPGGSMEQTYLTGQRLTEADILSLIPPRPCLIIVGEKSGEEPGHRRKLTDMLRFYEGLGVDKDRGQLVLVDGVHNMKQPKRVAAYGWVNTWFDREAEGATEPPLSPETVKNLRCTETGLVVRDLGGETGHTLNAKLAQKLRPPRPRPRDVGSLKLMRERLKRAISGRIGLTVQPKRSPPVCTVHGSFAGDGFDAQKLTIESEPGICLPSLLLTPKGTAQRRTVMLHAAETGKPTSVSPPSLAVELARKGYVVLSVDVRGAGETDPRTRSLLSPLTRYDAQQFRFDSYAVRAAHSGATLLAMRANDVIRAMDYLAARKDLTGRPMMLVGEGLGGVWTLMAAAFDDRPAGVVCVGTVPSYKLIVESQTYATRDYFWINGALKDFDLPDLVGLIAPRSTLLLDPVDALLRPLAPERCREILAWPRSVYAVLSAPQSLRLAHTAEGTAKGIARELITAVE